MAGVTKVAIIYDKQFWKDDNDQFQNIIGRLGGPVFQVYDSSTATQKDDATNNSSNYVAALTAFALATESNIRQDDDDNDERLAIAVRNQIAQAFQLSGKDQLAKDAISSYVDYQLHRWPYEKYISEESNPRTIQPHPYPVQILSKPEWDNQLYFAGTEMDTDSPGVMEGAIGSAYRVLGQVLDGE